MVYKNGFKVYLFSGLAFGIPMGIIVGLLKLDVFAGVISFIIGGCLFPLLIFLFVHYNEKLFDVKRAEIAKTRRIICDDGATIQGTGGWLFLTEQGAEFYPHKVNTLRETLTIPLNMIKDVKTQKNQIVISTSDNLTYIIVVSRNKEWKQQFDSALSGLS